jgi:hypothetical protein
LEKLGYMLYCRNCSEPVDVYECHRREKVLPEIKPAFKMVTWFCVSCNEPAIEVTELHRRESSVN